MPRVRSPGARGHGSGASSSDEGGFELADSAAAAVFERYINALEGEGDDVLFVKGMSRVKQYLQSSAADSSACLICLNTIKPTEAVWSCSGGWNRSGEQEATQAGCWAVLHLSCMQEWARSQIDASVLKTMNRLSSFPGAAAEARATAEWGCPNCRCPYPAADIPRDYSCFCGKEADPEWDPWRAPHSCGELCGRPLNILAPAFAEPGRKGDNVCQHSCLLLCHPGPCPPCPLVVDTVCHCGKRQDRRRCGKHTFSCGQVCGVNLLDCGHCCEATCHEGPCPPCPKVAKHKCRCGGEARTVTCHERDFQCTRVCGKSLACGNPECHCKQVCHAGACAPCPNEGLRTCPCGKAVYEGLGCKDRVQGCGATCDKLLPCGHHQCQDRCHTGPCGTCRALIDTTCRCGKMKKQVLCNTELLCDWRCTSTRACGRHPCKRRCCDGTACPPCEEVCGRKLRCGNHRCPAPCHPGPCRPCPLTVAFGCACGRMSSTLPCGAESRAIPPRCYGVCPVPGLCRHAHATPSGSQHRCHWGPCPPCTSGPCGTALPCGHTCPSGTCHDLVPPTVAAFQPPAAPKTQPRLEELTDAPSSFLRGDRGGVPAGNTKGQPRGGVQAAGQQQFPAAVTAAAARQLLDTSTVPGMDSCPACPQPVTLACLGGHTESAFPCCKVTPWACTKPCGRPLPCGNHACQMPCHVRMPDPGNAVAGASTGTALPPRACLQTSFHASRLPMPAPQPCQTCSQACGKQRACGHACPTPCHPGDCPPCVIPSRVPCSCGKTSLSLTCHELSKAAGVAGALTCNKPCHRPLPSCPHPCRQLCHEGLCAEVCPEEVTVRCQCKGVRAKWSCAQVQEALHAAGRPRTYDATTTLRLLPCDATCPVATKGPATSSSAVASKGGRPAEVSVPGPVAAKGPPVLPQAQQPKSRQSKAEREADAQRRQNDRERSDQMMQHRTKAIWVLVVVVGIVLGLFGPKMLERVLRPAA